MKTPGQARGATIYVTLEPCSTHGRTPPCTSAILEHGFARVVFGATDPNPSHAGRAERLLRDAGVAVTRGILADECADLNAAWNHWIVTRRPYLIAKCGMSLDGRIASHPESRWITSEVSRAHAMRVRAEVDAILVGGGTLRTDDPQLTVRGIPGARQPWRVVWSQSGNFPATAKLFTDEHRDRHAHVRRAIPRRTRWPRWAKWYHERPSRGRRSHPGRGVRRASREPRDVYMARKCLAARAAVGGLGISEPALAPKLKNAHYERLGNDVLVSGDVDYE